MVQAEEWKETEQPDRKADVEVEVELA